MACISQGAVVVVPKEERTEGPISRARIRPAADDELLLLNDFDLSPIARALAAVIYRPRLFGDKALPAVFDRVLKELARVASDDVAHAQNGGACIAKDALEARAPLDKWQWAKIFV